MTSISDDAEIRGRCSGPLSDRPTPAEIEEDRREDIARRIRELEEKAKELERRLRMLEERGTDDGK